MKYHSLIKIWNKNLIFFPFHWYTLNHIYVFGDCCSNVTNIEQNNSNVIKKYCLLCIGKPVNKILFIYVWLLLSLSCEMGIQ